MAAKAPSVLYMSPDGSDASRCTSSAPCGTFARAYRVAKAGTTVEIAGGTYGADAIPDTGARPGKVIFRPKAGAKVTLTSELQVYGQGVEFRGLDFADGWYVRPGASRIVFRGDHTADFFITSASNISLIGGDVGPVDGLDGGQIKSTGVTPRNILIDRVRFHDITRKTDPSGHVDCLQIGSGNGIIIRRSRFSGCATQSLFIDFIGSTFLGNMLIENNWFAPTIEGYYTLIIGGTSGNIDARYNSGTQSFRVIESAPNVRLIANDAPLHTCVSGVTYAYNVWQGTKCSATDRNAGAGFVNANGFNLDLRHSSPAVNHGDPNEYPRVDIHGHRRPLGRRPDAGADELR